MKPDEKYFPVLSSNEGFSSWWKDLYVVALATGMDCCLNFATAPSPHEPGFTDYTKRNRWFFYILSKTVKTNEGRTIIDRFRTSADGRATLQAIYEKGLNSGAASITSATRMEELMAMRLDKNYSKPYVNFINEFLRRAQQYNDMQMNRDERFSEGFTMTMLKNAVSPVRELAALQARERHNVAMGGSSYDYTQYVALLKDEAERLDGLRRKRSDRSAHVTEISTEGDSSAEEDALYQAFKTALRTRRDENSPGWMDTKVFSKLTPEAKSTWNKIPEADRQTILQGFRQVNFSQLTEDEGESIKSEQSENVENSSSDRGEETGSEDSNDRKVNIAETSDTNVKDKAHPGNVARVLGQKSAKTPSTKRSTNVAQWKVSNVDWKTGDGTTANSPTNQDDTNTTSIDWPVTGKALSDLWQEDESSSDEDFL